MTDSEKATNYNYATNAGNSPQRDQISQAIVKGQAKIAQFALYTEPKNGLESKRL